jgi:hypothetical protein
MRCVAPSCETATSRSGRYLDGRIRQDPNRTAAPDGVSGQTQNRRGDNWVGSNWTESWSKAVKASADDPESMLYGVVRS